MNWLQRLRHWLRRFYRRPEPLYELPSAPSAPPDEPVAGTAEPPTIIRRNRPPDPTMFEAGAHYYFGDLLEDLNDYFEVIRFMRTNDLDNYQLYRRMGAQVSSASMLIEADHLPAEWMNGGTRQMAGMCHMRDWRNSDKNIMPAAFVSFCKHKHYLTLSPPPGGSIYEATLYWFDMKVQHMVSGRFHVLVDAQCRITPLRKPRVVNVALPPSKGSYIRRTHDTFPRAVWDYGFLPDLLEDRRAAHPDEFAGLTVEQYARNLFTIAVNSCYSQTDGLQVRVRKDGIVARFHIGMTRTPYFFKDREKTITVNGTVKRIFHIVRAHRRILASGEEKYVKSHFRGERRFNWKGYFVTVSMPGWHHERFEEVDIAAETFPYDAAVPDGYKDNAWLGDALNRLYEKGRLGRKGREL